MTTLWNKGTHEGGLVSPVLEDIVEAIQHAAAGLAAEGR